MYVFPMHPSETRDSLNDQPDNKMSGKRIFSSKTTVFIEKFYLGEKIQVSIDIL